MKKNLEKVVDIAGKVDAHAEAVAAIAGRAGEIRAKAEELAARGKEAAESVRKSVGKAVREAAREAIRRAEDAASGAIREEAGTAAQTPAAAQEPQTPAETPKEPALSWCYGYFDGSKAKVVEDAVLGQAKLTGDVLTYSWEKGGCEKLGATNREDANHTLACLFLEDGAGGKFEWVSTSRTARSVKNIKDGYNGWPKTALERCGRLWFCIAGVKDDKKTSNGKRTALVEVERA